MVVLIQDIVDGKSLTALLKALPFDAAQNRQIAVAVAALAADNPAIAFQAASAAVAVSAVG